jgi:hypothetical protein
MCCLGFVFLVTGGSARRSRAPRPGQHGRESGDGHAHTPSLRLRALFSQAEHLGTCDHIGVGSNDEIGEDRGTEPALGDLQVRGSWEDATQVPGCQDTTGELARTVESKLEIVVN